MAKGWRVELRMFLEIPETDWHGTDNPEPSTPDVTEWLTEWARKFDRGLGSPMYAEALTTGGYLTTEIVSVEPTTTLPN